MPDRTDKTSAIKTPKDFYTHTGFLNQRCDEIYSRHAFMKAELNRLFDLSTGRSTPLAHYTTDKSGKISERKVQMLINRIMECYEREYIERSPSLEKWHQDCKEFYKCFLYCAIRGFTAKIPLEFNETQTFGDIIRIATNTDFQAKHILEQEFSSKTSVYPDCAGFFGSMCYAYKLLTGKDISDEFTAAQRALIPEAIDEYEDMIQQNSDWEEEYRTREDGTFMTDEEFEEALKAETPEYEDIPYSPEDQELIEEQDNLKKTAEAAKDKWISGLTDPDKFIRCYKRARKLCFKYGGSLDIADDVTKMIDCFLCINGASDLCDKETAVDTIYYIRRAAENIENSRRKRGLK